MAKFKFRLEPVLRQRQMLEDIQQRELAKALRERMILQTQLQTMRQRISQSKFSLSHGLVGQVDMDEVTGFARYSGQEAERGHQIIIRMAGLEKQIQISRGRLVEATRNRRTIELLRQRHLDRWRRTQQRLEDNEQDELVTPQFLRWTDRELPT